MGPSRFIAVFSSTPSHLFEIAHMLSPRVEACPPDGILLEMPARYEQDTLSRLSHVVDRNVKIGGASTRTAAIFAAKTHPGTIVPYGRERHFLAPLPIRLLSLHTEIDEQMLQTLSRWGVKTLGELASLPEAPLVARLGQYGTLLQRIARGEDTQLFQPIQPEPEFEETQELEWTLDSLEPLSFILGRMLDSLCSRLRSQGFAVERLRIQLRLVDGSLYERDIKLALPMRDPQVILSLVRLELQTYSPPAGITTLTIQAQPARPRVLQHSLLYPAVPNPEKLSRTLRRLAVLVGEENLGCPKVMNTHRPDAFQIEALKFERNEKGKKKRVKNVNREDSQNNIAHPFAQLSLRRLRPPQPTDIQREKIVYCAGPWRCSGDWWRQQEKFDGWAREEWDIELKDGGIYRVYWDQIVRKWFMEGIYD